MGRIRLNLARFIMVIMPIGWLSLRRSETTVEEEEKEGQPSLIIYYCTYLPVIAIRIAEVSVLSRSFSRWFSGKKWQKKCE